MLASDFLNPGLAPAGVLAEGEGPGQQVAIHLSTTDLSGRPISSVSVGQRFLLQASVEDLRDDAAGVFAAYFDVEFDPARALVRGPLVHDASFLNGVSGSFEDPGLIDEVGGFRSTLFPTGIAFADLFSVVVTAESVGQLVFETNPADILPQHAVLLYQVNTMIPDAAVDFGRVAIEVTPFGGNSDVDAFDDSFTVLAGSTENRLDVLANDAGFGDLFVAAVDDTGLSGAVTIAPHGHGLLYSPAADFVGVEQFSYTAGDGSGNTDDALVTIRVNGVPAGDQIVSIRLAATDLLGTPIASITEGSDFLLHAYVADNRSEASGVFAAYLDVLYSADLVEPLGEIVFGSEFTNGISGDFEIPGVVNEVGAFERSFSPVLGGESLLFSLPFSAIGAGRAGFQSDPADVQPLHAVLVYGNNEPIPEQHIEFGGFTLDVVADVIAVDDSYHVAAGATVELNVLDNDVRRPDDELRILEVDRSTLSGTVLVADDGGSLIYTPAAGFAGTEQFTYVAEGRLGVDSAQVTVHTEPGASSDDVVAIDLATVDLAGNPISSIGAGQEFWLTATVADLRVGSPADLGVFAAFLDLLYDAEQVSVVDAETNHLGFDVIFGAEYLNGRQGRATVPGLIDEIGSFQSSLQALGPDPQDFFAVRMRTNSAIGRADSYVVQEDAQAVVLNVLENDTPNSGTTVFRGDPADIQPISDVLLFEPPDPVDLGAIRFGETELTIDGSAVATITAVGRTSRGGNVVISADGQHLEYTPAANFFGVERFTYSVDHGPAIDVEVVVEPVADAPVANDDHYRVRVNRRLTIDAPEGPLANDSDPDGDSLEAVNILGPNHGSLEIAASGSFVYVPEPDFIGSDQFTYRAFDGGLVSAVATVHIVVEPPPVRIRLDVVDATGAPQSHTMPGQTVFVQALVQDLRDESYPIHGVGAAYLDLAFDPTLVSPVPVEDEQFDIAIEFGDLYQNGKTVVADVPGLLENAGAFQTGFSPLGPDELELFTVEMQVAGLQAVDDQFTLSGNSRVNSLDVLANELGLIWEVPIDAGPADGGPLTDVVLYDPPDVVPEEDIAFVDTILTVNNGTDLTVLTAGLVAEGSSESGVSEFGGSVTVVGGGARVEYVPPVGFVGIDSFEYTVVDGNGATGTAKVRVEVVQSWQNQLDRFDVNSDGVVTAADVLALINELNRRGARKLPTTYTGPHFFDVNGDGYISPQDVLAVINRVNNLVGIGGEGEGAASRPDSSRPSAGLTNTWLAIRSADALLPLELGQPLLPVRGAKSFDLAPDADQPDQVETAGRLAAARETLAGVPRVQPTEARFDANEGAEVEDDLIEGLDELAGDVAQFWAEQP